MSSNKVNIGHLIDTIWLRIPKGHYLQSVDPTRLPAPHESYLAIGRDVVSDCLKMNAPPNVKLKGHDHDTWLRLVAAWTIFIRDRSITRSEAAKRINMDASNLTNFINGKRPLTQNAASAFAVLFGIQRFDLQPELGAAFARDIERKTAKKLSKIATGLASLREEISSGANMDHIVSRIECLEEISKNGV